MSTPHERLIRTTFSLPFGEVHALVGGAVNARPLLFLHGFPDHPPTAVPFLEHLAQTHRVVAPWLRGYAPSPIASATRLTSSATTGEARSPTPCAPPRRRTSVARSRSRSRTRPPSYARSPPRSSGRRAGTWGCSSSQEPTISCAAPISP